MNFLKILGVVLHIASVQATADTNGDGTVDGNEETRAIVRMLPDMKALFPGMVQLKGKLSTPDGQAAFGEELVALLDKYEQ